MLGRTQVQTDDLCLGLGAVRILVTLLLLLTLTSYADEMVLFDPS